jgi:hypothetical protein
MILPYLDRRQATMPVVAKHRKPPAAWREYRGKASHPALLPLLLFDWLCQRTAYHLSRWSFLEILEYVGSFSILVAVILYFAETGERRQQKHYQAWQVINTAQGKGGNGGRLDALGQLNEDGVALIGVDLDKAFLQNVSLDKAELRRATFREADLRNAHFHRAGLQDADLTSANLRGADVRDADLSGANLNDTDLTGADFSGSNLHAILLDKADLRDVDLKGCINWKEIQSIRLANVQVVRNPPAGFVQWALEHGAVQFHDTEKWNDAIRQFGAGSR